jgi:hypothetical protein
VEFLCFASEIINLGSGPRDYDFPADFMFGGKEEAVVLGESFVIGLRELVGIATQQIPQW